MPKLKKTQLEEKLAELPSKADALLQNHQKMTQNYEPACRALSGLERIQGQLAQLKDGNTFVDSKGKSHTYTAQGKADLSKALRLKEELCKDPSKEAIIEVEKFELDKDARTCVIRSRHSNYRFKLTKGQNGEGQDDKWVIIDPPVGQCGVLLTHRFEGTSRGRHVWNYYIKGEAPDPTSLEDILASRCAELVTYEHAFLHEPQTNQIHCDYFEYW